jgi:hypothetical protein
VSKQNINTAVKNARIITFIKTDKMKRHVKIQMKVTEKFAEKWVENVKMGTIC